MKNYKPIAFSLLIIGVLCVIGYTIAYYSTSDSFSNKFYASDYVVEVEETFESPDHWEPGDTAPKEVIATNRSEFPVAVRVKLTSSWEDANGNPISIFDSDDNLAAIINFTDGYKTKWTYINGYYYYLTPLEKDESTTSLLDSVTFNPEVAVDGTTDCQTNNGKMICTSTLDGYAGGKYTLQVDIETCQYNKYEEIWGDYIVSTWGDTLTVNSYNSSNTFRANVARENFEKIITVDYLDIPSSAIDSWDCSAQYRNSVMCWYTDKDNDGKYELYIGQIGGVNANPNSSYAFYRFQNVEYIDLSNYNTSKTTNMSYMFNDTGHYANNMKIVGLDDFDTSKVTNMTRMFFQFATNAQTVNIGDLSSWDTSKVTDMSWVFATFGSSASTINIGYVANWDTSAAETMRYMFQQAGYNATTCTIGDLSDWDTSKVTDMSDMFSSTCYNATSFNIGNIGNWDTSKVTDMSYMFSGAGSNATSWSIGDLSNWNTSNVTNMRYMFSSAGYNASTFNIGNVGGWNTSQVTIMEAMFSNAGRNATSWSIGNLSNWNTSSVTNMSYMFLGSGYQATTFNIGNIGGWDTSNVTTMQGMFNLSGAYATTWYIGNLNNWDTSKVTTMQGMFKEAARYSPTTTTWNIGTLKIYATDIENMFQYANGAKAILNIYSNPTSYSSAFQYASTRNGSGITVNYSSTTTNINNIIATRTNTKVVKGSQLN